MEDELRVIPRWKYIKAEHTASTLSDLQEWWWSGVIEMRCHPLAWWKTDNPTHPNHRGEEVKHTSMPLALW